VEVKFAASATQTITQGGARIPMSSVPMATGALKNNCHFIDREVIQSLFMEYMFSAKGA
jgi:hypothetical protein